MSVSSATPLDWRREGQDAMICLSLGGLTYIRRWYDLQNLEGGALDYFRGAAAPAPDTLLWSTVAVALVMALVYWSALKIARLLPGKLPMLLAHCGFLATLAYPLESVRRYWNMQTHRLDLGSNGALLFLEGLLLVGIVLRLRGSLRVVRAARSVALMAFFLFPVMVIDFGLAAATPAEAFVSEPSATWKSPTKNTPRVLWLLFDEFDERIAFEARPASVQLPELDRLRSEALSATHVEQTATDTIIAVPTLLTGRPYSKVQVTGADRLMLYPEDGGEPRRWDREPSVFGKVRDLGRNAEIVGWYHPYCRLFGNELARCFALSSEPTPSLQIEAYTHRIGLLPSIPFLLQMQGESFMGMLRGDSNVGWLKLQDDLVQQAQQQQFYQIRDRTLASAGDERVQFGYYHFPTPHLFPIYDRKRQSFTLRPELDYLDNLALVDRTLGELRRDLEAKGLWEQTTLLISSDHALRTQEWKDGKGWNPEMDALTGRVRSTRVPFLLKIAGDRTPLVLDRPFSAIVTGELLLAILKGEVATHAQAAQWLKQRTVAQVTQAPRSGSLASN